MSGPTRPSRGEELIRLSLAPREMSGRDWANTPELRSLIATALANGADDWTVSAEDTTRTFLAEKERLQRLQGKRFHVCLPSDIILNCITLCPTMFLLFSDRVLFFLRRFLCLMY